MFKRDGFLIGASSRILLHQWLISYWWRRYDEIWPNCDWMTHWKWLELKISNGILSVLLEVSTFSWMIYDLSQRLVLGDSFLIVFDSCGMFVWQCWLQIDFSPSTQRYVLMKLCSIFIDRRRNILAYCRQKKRIERNGSWLMEKAFFILNPCGCWMKSIQIFWLLLNWNGILVALSCFIDSLIQNKHENSVILLLANK